MGRKEHEENAERYSRLGFSVITVSDTKGPEEDLSGRIIIEELKKRGHELREYFVCKDDVSEIRRRLKEAIRVSDFVVVNGGTGISERDVTVEAIRPMFEREIPGFGELFRYLSYLEIGPSAILSRAVAGIITGVPVFCLPGSPDAVRLGIEKIIGKVISHLIFEVRR